jgi:hypothetical protein
MTYALQYIAAAYGLRPEDLLARLEALRDQGVEREGAWRHVLDLLCAERAER